MFHAKANQRDVTEKEKRRGIQACSGGGSSGIHEERRESRQQPSERRSVSTRGATGKDLRLLGRSGWGKPLLSRPPNNPQRPWQVTARTTLQNCNNKSDLAGTFLPISDLNDASQTFPSGDYFCRAPGRMVTLHGLAPRLLRLRPRSEVLWPMHAHAHSTREPGPAPL